MIPKELIKRVRLLDIKTKLLVDEIFCGEYHSTFKGRGIEFSETREYQYGDDTRLIDWNVTARFGKPFVKVYEEERELVVSILFDMSASTSFGSRRMTKRDCMIEIAALLAFSAVENNDQVGAVLFSDCIEQYVPPRKDKTHALRILRELLYHQARGEKTDMKNAFDWISTVQTTKSIVFVLSDFFDTGYEKSFKLMSKRHDVIPILIEDPFDRLLADSGGIFLVGDIEGNESGLMDMADPHTKDEYRRRLNGSKVAAKKLFVALGIDYIEISTERPYIRPLFEFFQRRARRL
jgi:uncharacterized protein (DUF58 family)